MSGDKGQQSTTIAVHKLLRGPTAEANIGENNRDFLLFLVRKNSDYYLYSLCWAATTTTQRAESTMH